MTEAHDDGFAGDLLRGAEELVSSITDPQIRAAAQRQIAHATAQAGRHDRAAAIARSIAVAGQRVFALCLIAEVLVEAGEHDHGAALVHDAEAAASDCTTPEDRVEALFEVAQARIAAGLDVSALVSEIERGTRTITDPDERKYASRTLAHVKATTAGQHHASDVVRDVVDPEDHDITLRQIAFTLADNGDFPRAETAAQAISDPHDQALGLFFVARALLEDGRDADSLRVRAEEAARRATNPLDLVDSLLAVAELARKADDRASMTALTREAETAARGIDDPDDHTDAVSSVVDALITAGDHDRAERLAFAIPDLDGRSWALSCVARAVATTGDQARAETIADSLTVPRAQVHALSWSAVAAARAGDEAHFAALTRRAATIAHSTGTVDVEVRCLLDLAGAVDEIGGLDEQVLTLLRNAGTIARSDDRGGYPVQLVAAVMAYLGASHSS
jgi:hypothetical protein